MQVWCRIPGCAGAGVGAAEEHAPSSPLAAGAAGCSTAALEGAGEWQRLAC